MIIISIIIVNVLLLKILDILTKKTFNYKLVLKTSNIVFVNILDRFLSIKLVKPIIYY